MLPFDLLVLTLWQLNILLNGKPVDALAMIVHRDAAPGVGRVWCKKLSASSL